MRLRIPNRLEDVFLALDRAGSALERGDVDPACRTDVRLVLEELLVNTVRHGYPDGRDGSIEIQLDIGNDMVRLELRDDAMPFDPLEPEPPELPGDIALRDIGGLGLHLARSIASDFHYARDEHGNRVVIRFDPSLSDEPAP
ncbi:MAG: ATP-binding protein [Luteibacter sp.]|uniref:ATP-binding protein n=1 Tax=Rhodanobacteraceae TaxID=1775411 RepID=UPI000689ADB9|nr:MULTISPECIES: ATP-binding protein [Rhodanobacteraceae]MDQ7997651.1 ATP-binding protein [Luteibacter sp.]MDQ8051239.1 ATP-binding protein [Luteibacter sp.]MDR6642559.1 anti-sigma regulatory factor (Ser/Thr protein kinase) [Luteibacter sp. 1214]SDG43201.1 serine/threonine-protein kinase RsbW [Dyella sp. 333MFSha]